MGESISDQKSKNTLRWAYIISDLNGEELQKTSQKEFRTGKKILTKLDKLYVKCKGCDNSSKRRIKRYSASHYSPEPYGPFSGNLKVELDLSKYTT